MSGTVRQLVNNMVVSVTKGFEKAQPGRRRFQDKAKGAKLN
jgi:hypothetical protein